MKPALTVCGVWVNQDDNDKAHVKIEKANNNAEYERKFMAW